MSFRIDLEDYVSKLIIGTGYKARSGKDTVAAHLVKHHGFERVAFADALKDVARTLFGFTDAQLYGDLKEVPDPWWNEALHFTGSDEETGGTWAEQLTPRKACQDLGVGMREIFNPDIWIAATFRKILASENERIVITDVRFPNEAEVIHEAGGYLWQIVRPVADRGVVREHISETALDGFTGWDQLIENHYTLENLFDRVDRAVAGPIHDFEHRAAIRLETTSCLGCLGQGAHTYGEDCGAMEVPLV